MSQPKQFLVYQQQRSQTLRPALACHVIIAGPFEEEAQAKAVARRRWGCTVREIGDMQGLYPEPVGCQCHKQTPDPGCLIGPYLFERATALKALTKHVGFGYLPPYIKTLIEKQDERWRRKYLQHLLHEERQHQA